MAQVSLPAPRGMFQADLIIASAIRAGIADLRANPWALDYVFRNLADDPLTAQEYGQKQVATAENWVKKTEIRVFMAANLGDVIFPCVTIGLTESAETDNTLGDVDYDVSEQAQGGYWPALAPAFTPDSWSPSTSEITVPLATTAIAQVFPGMNVFDSAGTAHLIQSIRKDSLGRTVAAIAPGPVADFRGALLKSGSPPTVTLEGAEFRESYLVGCHASESWQLIALHSLVGFVLLRYRQQFLEARGFQASSIASTDFAKNNAFEGEQIWTRYVNLTGKVRQVWPKARVQQVSGISTGFQVLGANHLPSSLGNPDDFMWRGDLDP